MENRPLVSVIIPFYKGVNWLCEAVESVLAQDYDNCEIIVVNDGSPEDTSGFLEKYGGKIKYFATENKGPAAARNLGISAAAGEYLAFLDSDDLWNSQKLSVQLKKLSESGARWAISDYELFGDEIKPQYRRVMPDGREQLVSSVPPYIATPTVIAERSLLADNGFCFCEALRFGQDIVLWKQLYSAAPSLYIPQSLARVRIRGTNAGRRAAVQIHARVDMYDKCAELIPGYKDTKSGVFKFATSLCRFGRKFVRRGGKSGFNEFLARVLFVVPYLLYKADR